MIKRKAAPDSRMERQIVTGMIVSSKFLKGIIPIFKPDSLQLPFARIVSKWCLEYYEKYGESPKKHIQDIFTNHSENSRIEEATLITIEKFLSSISEEYSAEKDVFNVKYMLDQAERFMRVRSLTHIKERLSEFIVSGRVEQGEEEIKQYTRVTRPESTGINLITNRKSILGMFDGSEDDYLFSLAGDLGRMVGPLERGYLMGLLAPIKVGKSWFLQEIALQGLFNGFKVLFVSFEMSQKKMSMRIFMNLTATPKKGGTYYIPVFDCGKNQRDECSKRKRTSKRGIPEDFVRPPVKMVVKNDKERYDKLPQKYYPCTACKNTRDFEVCSWIKRKRKDGLSKKQALKKGKALKNSGIRDNNFRFLQFPSGSVSMNILKTHIKNLEYYEGFVPDIIVTDYADKMIPNNTKLQRLDAELEIWESHKALSQEMNCLVVTANQSNTVRTGAEVGQGSWAGNIQKIALVDVAVALNQTPEEKRNGIIRVKALAERNEEFDLMKEVLCLQCLTIGKPCLDSYILL